MKIYFKLPCQQLCIPGDLALRSSLETKGPAGGRDCLKGEDLPWQDMNFTHWIDMEGNSKENCYLKTEKLTYHKVNKQTSPAIISFAVLYYFNVKVGWKAASQLFRILAAHISVHSFPKKFWKHISKYRESPHNTSPHNTNSHSTIL